MVHFGQTTSAAIFALGISTLQLLPSSAAASRQAAAEEDRTEAERRCGRAVLAARSHVLTTDTRSLARCALAVLSGRRVGDTEEVCQRLRTNLVGIDLADRRARKRIADSCSTTRPAWLARSCEGLGSWSGSDVESPEDLASCVVNTTHCFARASVETLIGPLETSVGAENPNNLLFEYSGLEGNSFDGCRNGTTTSTSTSTTSITTSTTSTTSTLPTATTTLPDPTTTTLAAPTTTVPVTTTLDDVTTTTTTTTTSVPSVADVNLIVTEIMTNPGILADSVGEYFEIKNLGALAIDLGGMVVRDRAANHFTVTAPLMLAPGAYLVFARNIGAADGRVDYVYGTAMSLGNDSDSIILELEGEIVDEVAYDASFPKIEGRSMELRASGETAIGNDAPSSWCASNTALLGGDFGTPGLAALDCVP
jgi:hypothetical protein